MAPFDFFVLLGGLSPVEVLDGGFIMVGAELGFRHAMPRRGTRPRSMMAFRGPSQRVVVDSSLNRMWAGYARWVSLGALTRC